MDYRCLTAYFKPTVFRKNVPVEKNLGIGKNSKSNTSKPTSAATRAQTIARSLPLLFGTVTPSESTYASLTNTITLIVH